MLALTTGAESAIREILSDSRLPNGSGVRIAADRSEGDVRFTLSLVSQPEPDDWTVEDIDVPVWVGPEAAPLLDDRVLDAIARDGGFSFSLGPKPG